MGDLLGKLFDFRIYKSVDLLQVHQFYCGDEILSFLWVWLDVLVTMQKNLEYE
jgi:hypothetical protein